MEFIESERGNQKQNIKLKKICGGQLSGGLLSCSHFKVFGLTRPGLEPTIYRTQGKHANHYTTIVFETLIDWNHLENTFKWAQALRASNGSHAASVSQHPSLLLYSSQFWYQQQIHTDTDCNFLQLS